MEILALMSEAKGDEAHHLYKEGDGSHRRACYDLMF